jgi:hypothetical protein
MGKRFNKIIVRIPTANIGLGMKDVERKIMLSYLKVIIRNGLGLIPYS